MPLVSTRDRRYSESGLFVCLEGGEGAGKSTQAQLLADALSDREVVLTREPGGTPTGQRIREILLDPETGDLDHRAEALLYAADKSEHLRAVILPALDRGAVVVCDRYVDSTLAYQGAGRDLDPAELEGIVRWATNGLRPHLTVLLDVTPSDGLGRFEERDRIEAEGPEFHARVRQGFLNLAEQDPEHYLVLDARGDRAELAKTILERVEALL
ncbi:MAG TPA: dTMP kinase [Marmoricola sp.]|nr:dTMP kinase [Marmoricola sp.]